MGGLDGLPCPGGIVKALKAVEQIERAVRKKPIDAPGELSPVDAQLCRRAGYIRKAAAQQLQSSHADIIVFHLLPG